MPIQTTKLSSISGDILQYLALMRERSPSLSFTSKEIAEGIECSWSAARKHLTLLYKNGEVKRGKARGKNKTFYYYL